MTISNLRAAESLLVPHCTCTASLIVFALAEIVQTLRVKVKGYYCHYFVPYFIFQVVPTTVPCRLLPANTQNPR